MENLFSLNSKLKLEEYEFSDGDFDLASEHSKENFMTKTPPTSYFQDALRRLKENKVAMVSLGFLIIVCIFAFIGPFFVKGDYTTQYRGDENLFPCLRYPFGTDKLGRDLMVRTMYGTRVSLIVGIFASLIVLVIGTAYGAISGYFGGKVDAIMMRFLDLIYSIPDVLVVILLSIGISQPLKSFVNSSTSELAKKVGVLGPALISIFIAFGLLYWVGMARIIRGQVLMLKKQ
ncbi:MAG: ABC transporter permease, partial [Anaerococcus hydrogenalis]|nr:ABC transporter permease [Anaerococcus hydrogenalis]